MNEAQTRVTKIDPVLMEKGWNPGYDGRSYWLPEVSVYPGRIDSAGEHRDPGFADYVLYFGTEAVGVIEAKADTYAFDKGETQARYYAEALGVRFAYATNGLEVLEIDLKTQATRRLAMKDFPTPEELAGALGADTRSELERACALVPFSQAGGKLPRYYQKRAVEAVIRRIGEGGKRALLTLATGTGKTFIAYQLCHKLVEAMWRNGKKLGEREPHILFITDRNILANQAQEDFYFQDRACYRYLAGTEDLPMDRLVYFTLFQTLLGDEPAARPEVAPYHAGARDGRARTPAAPCEAKYKLFPPDFFDLVIIDECHRGGRNDESQWRTILDYFADACHVGLTATPQCDVNGDTYAYFGRPVYEYSLKRGISDGFLTQYRVAKLKSTLSHYQVTDGDIIEYPEEVNPLKDYGNDQIERKRLLIDERDRHFVDVLFERMPRNQKAIVFCVTQQHARRIARLVNEKARDFGVTDPHYCEVVTADSGTIGETYLKQFQDNANEIPTVLTTSQKLSTGVNAKNIRSIVLFRNVNSMVEFKQIIGRGTRVYPGKGYFTIYDFTDATDLFEDPTWDGDPVCPKCGQNPCVCKGKVENVGGGGENGGGTPHPHDIRIKLSDSRVIEAHWEDYVFVDGHRVALQDFIDSFVAAVKGTVADQEELRKRWANPDTRDDLLTALDEAGFSEDRLKDIQKIVSRTNCDILDVMLDLVYGIEPVTRAWRAQHLESELKKMLPARRGFAEVVLSQYVEDGVWSLNRATLFNYIKMKYGSIDEAVKGLGCGDLQKIVDFYDDLQENLYAAQ